MRLPLSTTAEAVNDRMPGLPSQPRDDELVMDLVDWFVANARSLPWRRLPLGSDRDPYRVLVSELMLQQTQVLRVVERFEAFVERFPTVAALAEADEREVLGLWAGLGYYRRARLLLAAARVVVDRFGGRFPADVEGLASLPGVGRYTAGAIASLAFGQAAAAVDANVGRVLLRLEGEQLTAAETSARSLTWARAAQLVQAAVGAGVAPGLCNEALIELGAVVCRKPGPLCESCPIAAHCRARAQGTQERIPLASTRAGRAVLYVASVRIEDPQGNLAVVERPRSGMWGGLYEAPTLERADRAPRAAEIRSWLGLKGGRLVREGSFAFATTHRDCRFDIYSLTSRQLGQVCSSLARAHPAWSFLPREKIATLGISSPQKRILLGQADK